MSRPSRLRHTLEHTAFRVLRWSLGPLPEALAVRMSALLGLLAGSVVRFRRSDVDRHLLQAFPDQPKAWRDRVARASYAHLGREAAMIFRMRRWSAERILARITFEGFEELRRASEAGDGAILLTGHLGNWEVAGAAIAAAGVPLDVVGKGMANPAVHDDLFATREQLGMRVIEMGDAPKGVLRSLRDGKVVAILADQNAHRSDLFVPFFGKDAATARGPALFAIRTGAPVFLGVPLRAAGRGQRYVLTFRRLSFRPTGDTEADTRALLTEYARGLEEAIRGAPEQYFWHHRRWKTRPGGPQEELPARR